MPLPAESAEGRELTEENIEPSLLARTQSWNSDAAAFVPRSRGLFGVREAARKDKKLRFTSLPHHITPELLRASFFALKKQAAPGSGGETWRGYGQDCERRIDHLAGRIHRGAYRAKPSKRTYIPKADGKLRPLGVAALEDKIVQQAVRTVLESIYEQDFLGITHISGKTRRGDFTIHRKTSRKKFQAKVAELKEKLSRRRHDDLAMVGVWLQSVFRGWCQYYAVPGHYARLRQFRDAIQVIWLRTLRRRSQRGRRLTWEKFSKLCKRWLPTPKILHPYPNVQFAGQHPR